MFWNKKINITKNSKHQRFEALLRPHIKSLYQIAYRFCGNQHDSEDLIQELLLKLYPKYDELVNIENLKSWMSRVLYNLFIDSTRKNDRSPEIISDTDPDLINPEIEIDFSGPEQFYNNLLIRKNIIAAMQKLNSNQKALIVLHDMEEYTLPELATMLETPVGTLKSRLHRARASIRSSLGNHQKFKEPFIDIKRVIK